ncbi:uncharacterized protein LOC111696316 [Eurytemora carolleeae]|uniref:uncharacterized protein LOC111696316 n=1 Tax=Eurytemora carolleeae TaxID=1294199 RepID=UPI000C7682BE|nr:uncharacterized protein LOC111696316 [Eurytemora carolleeae]|eukprot:XP_023321655.1 uncharacterized protein LOC111696316 [Eurytemora affinis]
METLELPSIEKRIILIYRDYVYTGKLEDLDNIEDIWSLYHVAHLYNYKGLQETCLSRVMERMTICNVLFNIEQGFRYVLHDVVAACWLIIDNSTPLIFKQNNWTSISKENISTYFNFFISFVHRYMTHFVRVIFNLKK